MVLNKVWQNQGYEYHLTSPIFHLLFKIGVESVLFLKCIEIIKDSKGLSDIFGLFTNAHKWFKLQAYSNVSKRIWATTCEGITTIKFP